MRLAFSALPCFNPAMPLVLITGASRGLGRALALGFSAAGWTVSACTTGPDAIRSLAKELGPEHLPQPGAAAPRRESRSTASASGASKA